MNFEADSAVRIAGRKLIIQDLTPLLRFAVHRPQIFKADHPWTRVKRALPAR